MALKKRMNILSRKAGMERMGIGLVPIILH
jgi:hypothetical protein